MDVYIKTNIEDIKELLIQSDFTVTWKKNHYSAIKQAKDGRHHILFALTEGETFCDFHFDKLIHFFGYGVDYGKSPERFFLSKLKGKLEKKKVKFTIKRVSWSTRRNKAIFTGFRL